MCLQRQRIAERCGATESFAQDTIMQSRSNGRNIPIQFWRKLLNTKIVVGNVFEGLHFWNRRHGTTVSNSGSNDSDGGLSLKYP